MALTSPHYLGPLDLDKHCGVFNDKKGVICTRSITCKVHSMRDKRLIVRSKPYDELVLDFRRAVNPNYVEPPKRETKAERKEKERRERREKRELDVREGRVDPNAPWSGDEDEGGGGGGGGAGGANGGGGGGAKGKDGSGGGGGGGGGKKKEKSKKKKASGGGTGKKGASAGANGGANGASGSGANAAAGSGEGGAGGDESEDGDIDSEAEADALIEAVQRSRGLLISSSFLPHPPSSSDPLASPITPAPPPPQTPATPVAVPYIPKPLGIPLALPSGASTFFIARNEALRCCADIVRSALGGGGSSSLGGGQGVGGGSIGFVTTSVPGSATGGW